MRRKNFKRPPKYLELKELLRHSILSGEFPLESKIPSQNQLKEMYRISPATAREAIGALVHEGLLERRQGSGTFVKKTLKEAIGLFEEDNNLHQQPFGGEKKTTLSGKNLKKVVIVGREDVFPHKPYDYCAAVFAGINSAAGREGCNIQVFLEDALKERKGILPQFEAVLILGEFSESLLKIIQKAQLPVLLLHNRKEGIPSIYPDNLAGIQKVVEFLYEKGHRKIGYIGGDTHRWEARIRFNAFVHTMQRLELSIQKDRIADGGEGGFGWDSGREKMEKILQAQELPTAIVTAADRMAQGAIDALKKRNLRVPEDVSITGFDNTELSATCQPPLTTIHVGRWELGVKTFTLLSEYVEKGSLHSLDNPTPVSLVVRDSVKELK